MSHDYQSISDAILERAIGAREKYSEFPTLHHAWEKSIEEGDELRKELGKWANGTLSESLSDMDKHELYERIYQEGIDCATVALRLCFLAKSKLGEVGK